MLFKLCDFILFLMAIKCIVIELLEQFVFFSIVGFKKAHPYHQRPAALARRTGFYFRLFLLGFRFHTNAIVTIDFSEKKNEFVLNWVKFKFYLVVRFYWAIYTS